MNRWNLAPFWGNEIREELSACVASALGTYGEIYMHNEEGSYLEKVIASSLAMYIERRTYNFDGSILKQINRILSLDNSEVDHRIIGIVASDEEGVDMITSGIGATFSFSKLYVEDEMDQASTKLMALAKETQNICYGTNDVSYEIMDYRGVRHIVYFRSDRIITDWDKNLIDLYLYDLQNQYNQFYEALDRESNVERIVFAIGETVEARTKINDNHVARIQAYIQQIGEYYGVDIDELALIKAASPLHDIGKLAVSDRILNKPSRLSKEEFEQIKAHPIKGYEMLKNSKGQLLKMAATIALYHHEKYDGSGYPYGKKGEEIPFCARVVALVDVLEALTRDSIYKKAWAIEDVFKLISNESGKHFDPKLVEVVLNNRESFQKLIGLKDETLYT